VRVVGYARVSSDDQARSGLGMEAQEAKLREECERRGLELLELSRDDGLTGTTLERPGLKRALERIALGEADGLVAPKLDRLSRSVIDFMLLVEWFEAAAARLIVLDHELDTGTANGRLMTTLLIAFAQFERDVISERTTAALGAKRARGEAISGPSVVDDCELTARIRAMAATGMSMQAIADQLNREGVATPRGGREWRPSSIQTVLGWRRRKARRKPAELPDLTAPEVQRALAERRRRSR
jgi:DNA invertase Pin-like site-specific DNA recombinase